MATRFLQQGAELTSVYFIGSDFNQTEGTAIYRSHGTLSDEDDDIKVEQQVLQLRLWFNGFKLSHTGILLWSTSVSVLVPISSMAIFLEACWPV